MPVVKLSLYIYTHPMRHTPPNLFAIFQESSAPPHTEQQIVPFNPEETNKNDQKTTKHDLPGD